MAPPPALLPRGPLWDLHPVPAVVVDTGNGRILFHNAAAQARYGHPDAAWSALGWKDLGASAEAEPRRGWQMQRDAAGQPLGTVVETHPVTVDGRAALLCFLVPTPQAHPVDDGRGRTRENVALMAGGMAHELNNQLSVLAAHASLLQASVLDANARESATAINGATQRVTELVRSLLNSATQPPVPLHPLDLAALVKAGCQDLAARLPPDARLVTSFQEPLPPVMADAALLRLALHNLADHALAASAASPPVLDVSVSSRALDRAALDAMVGGARLQAGVFVVLEVGCPSAAVDGGDAAVLLGAAPVAAVPGQGLRLASVQAVARLHKVALGVNSPAGGQGLTVTMVFPVISAVLEQPRGAVGPVAASAPSTILVADDEESVRSVVTRILERSGHRVVTACDGAEAMAVFRQHAAELAAVILDVTMPRQGGDELVAQIRALKPQVRIILMSGYTEEDATGSAASMPDAFIRKPFLPEELRSRLKSVLQGH